MALTPDGWMPMLRVILVGLVLLFVPGFFLQCLLLRASKIATLARIPISFAFSVGIIALIGVAAFVLGGSLATVQVGLLAGWVGLALLWLARCRPDRRFVFGRLELTSPAFWPGLLVVLFALGCAALAYYGGTWLSQTADEFYHLAAIRRQIDVGTALPQGLFYVYEQPSTSLNVTAGTWHLVLSLFSLWSGVDITWLWLRLPVVLAPLLVISFYSFANGLFGKAWIALLGTVIQFVLYDKVDFRVSVRSNQVGFILLWVAFILVFEYLDDADMGVFVAVEALVVVLASWHLLMVEFFFLGIGAYLFLRWLAILVTQHKISPDQECRRLLTLLVPAVLVGVPFIMFKAVGGEILYTKKSWLEISEPTFRSTLNLGSGLSVIGPSSLRRADPRWHFAPLRFALWLFAYLTVFLLIPPCLKLRRFALFLLAAVVIVLFVLLNPFLITFLQGKMSDVGLQRLVLLPSYGLILGWFFWEYVGRWLRLLPSVPAVSCWISGGNWRLVLGLVVGGAVLTLMAHTLTRQGVDNLWDLYSTSSAHRYSMTRSRDEMHLSWQPQYTFLIEHSLPGTVVASDPEYGYYLGGVTGRSVISVPYTHTPPPTGPSFESRYQDSIDILDASIELDETVDLLDKYGVCLVWVDRRMTTVDPVASREKFEAHPDVFESVYDDPVVSIYSYLLHKGKCVQ